MNGVEIGWVRMLMLKQVDNVSGAQKLANQGGVSSSIARKMRAFALNEWIFVVLPCSSGFPEKILPAGLGCNPATPRRANFYFLAFCLAGEPKIAGSCWVSELKEVKKKPTGNGINKTVAIQRSFRALSTTMMVKNNAKASSTKGVSDLMAL